VLHCRKLMSQNKRPENTPKSRANGSGRTDPWTEKFLAHLATDRAPLFIHSETTGRHWLNSPPGTEMSGSRLRLGASSTEMIPRLPALSRPESLGPGGYSPSILCPEDVLRLPYPSWDGNGVAIKNLSLPKSASACRNFDGAANERSARSAAQVAAV